MLWAQISVFVPFHSKLFCLNGTCVSISRRQIEKHIQSCSWFLSICLFAAHTRLHCQAGKLHYTRNLNRPTGKTMQSLMNKTLWYGVVWWWLETLEPTDGLCGCSERAGFLFQIHSYPINPMEAATSIVLCRAAVKKTKKGEQERCKCTPLQVHLCFPHRLLYLHLPGKTSFTKDKRRAAKKPLRSLRVGTKQCPYPPRSPTPKWKRTA